jgi:hypothetical protein
MQKARIYRAYETESSPIVALLLACPLIVLFWWTGTSIAFAVAIFMIYNCTLARALRMYLPPSALLLTTSASDTVKLHTLIAYHFNAFRTVQLLKGDISSEEFQYLNKRDCFRTKNDDVWESLVESFIQVCPLVILDARHITPALVHEAKRIVKSDISHKLVILIGKAGQRPLIDRIGINFKHEVIALREAGLLTLLEFLFVKFPSLPTNDNPLSAIIRSSRTWETVNRSDWPSRPNRPISGQHG